MTIALVILHADPARGGAERYTADLAAALAARGHRVSVLAGDFGPPVAGVEFVPLAANGATRLGRYVRFLRSLETHLSGARYDVVHAMLPVRGCDVYHPHAGLAIDAVAGGHAKHAWGPKRAAARVANRLNRKRVRFARVEQDLLTSEAPPVVLCLSEYVKRTVNRWYPRLAIDRLATLFNAVDLKKFDPARNPQAREATRAQLGLGADRVVALTIAQDFVRKGLREAIAAVSAVKHPRLALVVVGKPDASAYRSLAREMGVEDRVIFAGPTDRPYDFYRAADLFVLPTRHDPCSLVVLEALAMGVPVISTAFNGACEIMTPGEHGFVLDDPADVTALADAMRRLIDPATRARCAAACAALRPRLSFEAHVDRLEQAYASAARPA